MAAGGHVHVNGRNLYVEQYGARDGQAVVLLHHGLGSIGAWKAQLPAMAAAGCRVVAYDRWGYGRSDLRPSFSAPHFEEDVADLHELLSRLGLARPVLLGHSDGGTIALYFAARYAEQVNSLIVVAAHIYVEDRMRPGIEALRQAYEKDVRFRQSLQRQHGDQTDAVFSNWYSGWVRPASLAWDMRPLLGSIACPALVVQGKEDEHATPQHAQDIAAGIPKAQLWLVDGAHHMLPQEMPDVFNRRALDFLEEVTKEESQYVQ